MFQANQATPWLFVGAPFQAEVMLIVRSRREPLTFNQRVLGSSPSALTIFPRGIVRLALVRAYGRVSGMSTTSNPYRGFRFPAEIINQAVWLYHCFSLSLREVELILAARGIVVSYETIRGWSLRFGRTYAKTLKRRRPKSGDKWFLDEVFVRIQGKLHYLWRAVDQYGNVLDVLVQSRRNTKAAKRFFRKLLKGLCYVPRVIVTDKLGSYGAANARSCRALNIARAGISTTAARSRTNPPEGGSAT